MDRNYKLHLPWVLCLGIILILSLTPGDQLPIVDFEWFKLDTAVHIMMYAVLSFLMLIGFFHQKNELLKIQSLLVCVSVVLIGLIIEFLQGNYIPKRYFSWEDVIANSIGTIIGFLIQLVYIKKELNLVRFLQ